MKYGDVQRWSWQVLAERGRWGAALIAAHKSFRPVQSFFSPRDQIPAQTLIAHFQTLLNHHGQAFARTYRPNH
jgi:hypothetical protein